MKEYKDLLTKEKKEFWIKNPIKGEVAIHIKGLPHFKMLCDNDDTVVKELYWTDFKGWEFTSLNLWNDLLQNVNTSYVFDIGAYSAIYSLIASKYTTVKKVVAFDIQDKCINRITENVILNNANEKIEVVQAACSNVNEEVPFYFYEEAGIISSVAGLVPKKMNNLETIVKAIRLDDWCESHLGSQSVGLIKMDVEGAEQLTLKGMKSLLEKSMPHILIEINDTKDIKAVKKLFPSGYSVYDINEKNMSLKKLKLFTAPSNFRNYLFTTLTKKELRHIFQGVVI